jgi:hypothetical protein
MRTLTIALLAGSAVLAPASAQAVVRSAYQREYLAHYNQLRARHARRRTGLQPADEPLPQPLPRQGHGGEGQTVQRHARADALRSAAATPGSGRQGCAGSASTERCSVKRSCQHNGSTCCSVGGTVRRRRLRRPTCLHRPAREWRGSECLERPLPRLRSGRHGPALRLRRRLRWPELHGLRQQAVGPRPRRAQLADSG